MEKLQDRRLVLFGAALLLGTLGVVYWPVIAPMVKQWAKDENYSHGFLVPFVSAYLAYMRREDLLAAKVRPCAAGLAVVVAGLVILLLGWLATEYYTMRASLVVVIAGSTLYLLGWEVFRALLVPIAYLLLMVPLPYILYDAAAFPLKLFVTKVSVLALKFLGVVVWQEGNILMFPNVTLEVADACSGLRSIMSLLALGVAYAMVLHSRTRDRVILVASTLPIAVFSNCLRVIATGVLAQYFGAAAAEGFFHEFAGLFVFAGAVVMFMALGAVLRRWP
ncbi:exosortase A [Desulfomicrobium salsuginis]